MNSRKRHWTRLLACLGLFSLLTGLGASMVRADGQGRSVRLTVQDLSPSKPRPVSGAAVAVLAVRGSHTTLLSTVHTDSHGMATITLPTPVKGVQYRGRTTYAGVSYEQDLQPGVSAQLPVYEATSSDTHIVAMGVTVALRRMGPALEVIEEWRFANSGTQTLVGQNSMTLPLPTGAVHVAVQQADATLTATQLGNSITVSGIVRPATGVNQASLHQLDISYALPETGGHPTLYFPTRYLIGQLQVVGVGSTLAATGFTATTLQIQGDKYPAIQAQAIPAGSTVAIGVDGPPAALPTSDSSTTLVIAADAFPTGRVLLMVEIGFLGLLVVMVRGRIATGLGKPDQLDLQRERARLIGAIAELDLLYARGQVPEMPYRRQRARDKGRLVAVAKRLDA